MARTHVPKERSDRSDSRSAISQNLSKLESDLGVDLFIRSPKGLIPTSTAHELVATISPHLEEISHHVNSLLVNQSSNGGILPSGQLPASIY